MTYINTTEANQRSSLEAARMRYMPILIFILASSFYLYEFALQVSVSVMTTELMADLHIAATGIGLLSASYFYAYSPMQIPAGLIFDRFGPRRMITIALLVCALGAYAFALTHSLTMASLGRFLMGFGSAFSFIGLLILVARWFPLQYFALMAGVAQFMSSIGAILGEVPMAHAIHIYGWRPTMMVIASGGALLAILIWLVVRDHPPEHTEHYRSQKKESEWHKLSTVCGNTQTWWVALYSSMVWAPIILFASLWGVPYLTQVYTIDPILAARLCAMIWLGIGIGSPLAGWWSDYLGKRCLPLTVSALLGLITTLIMLYVPGLSIKLMYWVLFLFGIGASGQALSFAVVRDINKPSNMGTASGFNNMAVVAGGALFNPLVGYMIKLNWDGVIKAGVPVYSAYDFRIALFVVPLFFSIAILVSQFFIQETNCCALPPDDL